MKRGHQSPVKWRPKKFNEIVIENTNLKHCISQNFLYDSEKEEEKLYNGLPCFYTDSRFSEGISFYKKAILYLSRRTPPDNNKNDWFKISRRPKDKSKKSLSEKSCVRRVKKLKAIPKGTVIHFKTNWYYPKTKIDTSFVYIQNKEKTLDIKYEVNEPSFFAQFTEDENSKNLVERLRQEGFLVRVYNSNPNRLIGEEEGQICIGYGYGKIFGFSTFKNSFRGYGDGCENILFDYFQEFNKWSQCNWINKETSIEEIINILKRTKK